MLDNYKEEQKIAYTILKNAIDNNKISHAYLIETLGNDQGYDFALSFAKALLCPNKKTNNINCLNCNQCNLINENNFIELEIIDTEEMWLKKENIVKLQKDFSFKPVIGNRKVYIIKNAEKIRESLANTLLKFIEEPEDGIIAILIAENHNKIIDTIVSRCQLISLSNKENPYSKNVIDNYDKELLTTAIDFINYYEDNKKETLIYTNSLFHNKVKDRINYNIAFDIIIMYYNDVLNFKLNDEILIFNDYSKEIKKISSNLTIENILKKINILIELKKLISNNVNLNLLIDKLILSFEKVNNSE